MSMQAVGAALSFISGMMNAAGEKYTAEHNEAAYYAQAQNILTQKGITARQYGTAGSVLQGQAIATAGRQGVKISGTVAQSISSSLTELNLQKGYELYNLETERVKAINNAKYQGWIGDTAMVRGFFSSAASALGAAGNSSFFSGGSQTPEIAKPEYIKNTQKTYGKKYKTGFEYGYTGNLSGLS